MSMNYEGINEEFLSLFTVNDEQEKLEMETLYLHFGFISAVEAIMLKNNISKKELASRVGTSASYVTQLFRGNKIVSLEMMAKIKLALDFNIEMNCHQEDIKHSVTIIKKVKYIKHEDYMKIAYKSPQTPLIESETSLIAS